MFTGIAVLIIAVVLSVGAMGFAFIAYTEEALPIALIMGMLAAILLTAVGFSIAGLVV